MRKLATSALKHAMIYDTCLKRILLRENHSTIKDERTAKLALGSYFKDFEDISYDEADEIYTFGETKYVGSMTPREELSFRVNPLNT